MDSQYRSLVVGSDATIGGVHQNSRRSSTNVDRLPGSLDISSESIVESIDSDSAEERNGLDPESSSNLAAQDEDEVMEHNDQLSPSSLPLLLQILFSFNGITLALPSTALMHVVNDRVVMPVNLLPTYAAIAFLPCSLRPLYALCNGWLETATRLPRHYLLSILLLANSVSIWATSWIPPQGIAPCFILAFLRSATSSWAEFLLGLVLLEHVKQLQTGGSQFTDNSNSNSNNTATVQASQYQAQAATARNLGSFVSYALATLYFGWSQLQLNHQSASTLLHLAAVVHLVGAILALWGRVGTKAATQRDLTRNKVSSRCRTRNSPPRSAGILCSFGDHSYHSVEVADHDDTTTNIQSLDEQQHEQVWSSAMTSSFETDHPKAIVGSDFIPSTSPLTYSSSNQVRPTANTFGLVLSFQLALILLTTRQAIVDATSNGIWMVLMFLSTVALLASGCQSYVRSLRWDVAHRIGLFLILRHAVPSSTYLMDSYLYTFLQSHPMILQLLSVHSMGISTVAAWLYGRYSSRPAFCVPFVGLASQRHHYVYRLIIATTIIASLASLCQILFVTTVPHLTSLLPQVTLILAVQSLVTLTGEWRFLPDVVLATVGAVDPTLFTSHSRHEENSEAEAAPETAPANQRTGEEGDLNSVSSSPGEQYKIVGRLEDELQYGTMISCIDFGEQVGALLAGPLVSIFQVNRENNWEHLDALVTCTAVLSVLSLGFLGLLPKVRIGATSTS